MHNKTFEAKTASYPKVHGVNFIVWSSDHLIVSQWHCHLLLKWSLFIATFCTFHAKAERSRWPRKQRAKTISRNLSGSMISRFSFKVHNLLSLKCIAGSAARCVAGKFTRITKIQNVCKHQAVAFSRCVCHRRWPTVHLNSIDVFVVYKQVHFYRKSFGPKRSTFAHRCSTCYQHLWSPESGAFEPPYWRQIGPRRESLQEILMMFILDRFNGFPVRQSGSNHSTHARWRLRLLPSSCDTLHIITRNFRL